MEKLEIKRFIDTKRVTYDLYVNGHSLIYQACRKFVLFGNFELKSIHRNIFVWFDYSFIVLRFNFIIFLQKIHNEKSPFIIKAESWHIVSKIHRWIHLIQKSSSLTQVAFSLLSNKFLMTFLAIHVVREKQGKESWEVWKQHRDSL